MAGGKETPRQKMIGMMYLVLTALLALNVSKQIVAAFITLNDKIDLSTDHLENRIDRIYSDFEMKGATLRAQHENMQRYEVWYTKSLELKKESSELVGFLLSECNEMIQQAEGSDWVESRDSEGNITGLKSLDGISNMDNYDIPTNLFVGGNPEHPNDRGIQIVEKIHAFRDFVTRSMGTYLDEKGAWSFDPQVASQNFTSALQMSNPEDTLYLREVYQSLTIPEKISSHDESGELPWVSVVFDHAPIVAAAAIFTSLKLDIKNAQAYAGQYMLDKIDVLPFKFNKIDAVAMASTEYINVGDSLNLNVRIAAYDTTEALQLRYGIDGDTADRSKWIVSDGAITLEGSSPGDHRVKGEIGVREKGELTWKPWEFDYTVGQPMGVVSQPEMRVLYWGYDNKLEGTASGFSPDRVSLSATGCTLTSGGNGKYIAHVDRGVRNATVRITGRNDKGESVSLGQFDFVCKPLPPAELQLGSIKNGDEVAYVVAKSQTRVNMAPDPSVMLTGLKYQIISGTLVVSNIPGQPGQISAGGALDPRSVQLLKQSSGKKVTIELKYRDDSGITRVGQMSFTVS